MNDIFYNCFQNKDCGYTLELPRQGFGSKIRKGIPLWFFEPQFYYIKVGYKGVYIIWTCYPDEFSDIPMRKC